MLTGGNMSTGCPMDETAADVPVRDPAVTLHRLPADSATVHPARTRLDVSRVPREELEDRFLRQHEETLLLKQQIHNQEDKIRKLGTKLMRLVKDRGRMEQLASGGAAPATRVRDVEMEEMMEELQEKVRGLQAEKEGLRQRLLVAKQQLVTSQRATPYGAVQPRVNSRLKKVRDDDGSPLIRPKSTRSLEGGDRPPPGQLPRYGHSLLEEARAEIRNLENVVESQRSHMEELENMLELLREELRSKEAEHEEHLLQLRQQHSSKLRSQVSTNVSLIKLQKQLADRSHSMSELEARFIHLQQSQQLMKTSHSAAMMKVDELSAQLKDERMKNLQLEEHERSCSMRRGHTQQLQERISELEQERDLLMDQNQNLVHRALGVSQPQQVLEQDLRLQVSQLEAALQADLQDKNQILDQIQTERDTNQKLTEENQALQVQCAQLSQQVAQLSARLQLDTREGEHDAADLTEALLLIKERKSQRSGALGFLKQEAQEEAQEEERSIRKLQAALAETIQDLDKTRNLLRVESRISRDYQAELQAAVKKMDADKSEFEQKLKRQQELLDSKKARTRTLEAQLRDLAYGSTTSLVQPDLLGQDADWEEPVRLQPGENLLELQIVGAVLAAPALQALGDANVSTFCTYSFYHFEPHGTPVAAGTEPRYGFTSRFVVSEDHGLLEYLRRGVLTVELHQALGLDWKTVASGRIALCPLLQQEGALQGSVGLLGAGEELQPFGSLQFWIRFRTPVGDRQEATGHFSSTPTERAQPALGGGVNELEVKVLGCSALRSRRALLPSPYVVYKFWAFPDHPTATVQDRSDPSFQDLRSYPVAMDADLHAYLSSEHLHFYVFDFKEEQMDAFMGKVGVELQPLLTQDHVSGVFPLSDPDGLPAGHLQVTLCWRRAYVPPPHCDLTPQQPGVNLQVAQQEEEVQKEEVAPLQKEEVAPLQEEEDEQHVAPEAAAADEVSSGPPVLARLPGVSLKSLLREKKVTFSQAAEAQSEAPGGAAEEDEEDEESHVSEGQLVAASAPSDDSEISEEVPEDDFQPAAANQSESSLSDSDDCIVHTHTAARKASERLRLEIVSLSLRPDCRAARDPAVVRLFVEFCFLDLPTEETPLALPKPAGGRSANYNYSKVIPLDAETNMARRRLLREVLRGRNPPMERIQFTVVSEPPEEEEQERECEEVGVASLRIADLLDRRSDVCDAKLDVVSVQSCRELLGSLTVSVEALEALQSIMEDDDGEEET